MTPDGRWYFDFISPFAYLQWPRVRDLLDSHAITPTPVLLGALLEAAGQKGPAEIPRKREFTYRHVIWQARLQGVPLRFPPLHPFNPLTALRLCVAAGTTPEAITAIYDWIWAQGNPGDDIDALAPVADRLGIAHEAISSESVEATLRANTEAAITAGIFGVPTLTIGDDLFWGNDAHDFALARLRDPALLQDPDMQHAISLPVGVRRR